MLRFRRRLDVLTQPGAGNQGWLSISTEQEPWAAFFFPSPSPDAFDPWVLNLLRNPPPRHPTTMTFPANTNKCYGFSWFQHGEKWISSTVRPVCRGFTSDASDGPTDRRTEVGRDRSGRRSLGSQSSVDRLVALSLESVRSVF